MFGPRKSLAFLVLALAVLFGGVTAPALATCLPVASAPKGRGDAQVLVDLEKPFAARKGWNGGHFYGGEGEGEIRDAMVAFRIDMNRELGVADAFMEDLNDAAKVEQALDDEAQTWAD